MGNALRRDGGFSVVEVLIAAGIFLIIAIGVVPMFTSAILRNRAGSESTSLNHMGLSRAEEVLELNFNDPTLQPATTQEYYSRLSRRWLPGTPTAADPGLWLRSTTITQFNVSDLLDDGILNTPLPAGSDPVFIHVKQVQVAVQHARVAGNPLGGRNNFGLRVLKTF
jgi:type II secretory pathway pseudopilin PulG